MGKKGTKRKTRWRVLPIGGENGCNGVCSNNEDDGDGDRDSASPPNTYARASSQRIPRSGGKSTATQRNGGYSNYRHRSYQHQSSNDSNHQPLVTTERKTFNEEEYTKITTPRQDVLFKKGYLGRKKAEVPVANTANTNVTTMENMATNGNAHNSDIVHNGETLEGEVQPQALSPMEDQPQYVYVDQSGAPAHPPGVYYINGSGYELYDPYSGNVTVVVGPAPPHYAGAPGAGPPVLAAVPCQPLPLQPIEWFNPAFLPYVTAPYPPNPQQHHRDRRKRYSTDSQNCSPQSSESTGPPGSPQECELEVVGPPLTMAPPAPPPPSEPAVFATAPPPPHYVYPGYMFGPPIYSVNGVTVQGAATQPPSCDVTGSSKRRKKKRRRRRRRGGEAEDGSEESSSDEKDLEEPMSVTSQGSELECDKQALNDSNNNNNNNNHDSSSSSSSSTSTSSLSPPCQTEAADFQQKVNPQEEQESQSVTEIEETIPEGAIQQCETELVQDFSLPFEDSPGSIQNAASNEDELRNQEELPVDNSVNSGYDDEIQNRTVIESSSKLLHKKSSQSTAHNKQHKKIKGKNKNKTADIQAVDTSDAVLRKGGNKKADVRNLTEKPSNNQPQKPSKKSQKKNKIKQGQSTLINGHIDKDGSNENVVTDAKMNGKEKETKQNAALSEEVENPPEENPRAEPFSLRPDAPRFDHRSLHAPAQHLRDTSDILDSITEVLAKDPSSIAGAQKSLIPSPTQVVHEDSVDVKSETPPGQTATQQPSFIKHTPGFLLSETEAVFAEVPSGDTFALAMGGTTELSRRSGDSPVPPPRRKKASQASPSFTKRKSAERRSPTPGRDLSSGNLTDESSSSTTHESEESVIDLLSSSTHTSPDDERTKDREKGTGGLVSSDEEADNVIYRSEESKPPDKPRSLDIVSRPLQVPTEATSRFAEEMSRRIIAEAVIESTRQKPITMAVTRWLRSQSPEAVLALPSHDESEVSSSEEDSATEATKTTGQKNAFCNPLPAPSLNERHSAPGQCVDLGGRVGRRVASTSYTDGNISDNNSTTKNKRLIKESREKGCHIDSMQINELNVQENGKVITTNEDDFSFVSENQECEWDLWDCNLIPQMPRVKTPVILSDEEVVFPSSQMYDPVLSVPKYYSLGTTAKASPKKNTPSSSITTSTLSISSNEEEEMDALKHFQHELAKEQDEEDGLQQASLAAELVMSHEPLPASWGMDALIIEESNNKWKRPRRVHSSEMPKPEMRNHISGNIENNVFVAEENSRNSRFTGPARLFQHSKLSIIAGTFKGDDPFSCGGICCILQ